MSSCRAANANEQRAVVAVAPAAWRPVVVLALLTGLRWSELAHLSWTDVRDDHLLVRRSRGGRATRGGRPRVVPLLEAARRSLASVADHMTDHAYQELASALEAPPRIAGKTAGFDQPGREHTVGDALGLRRDR